MALKFLKSPVTDARTWYEREPLRFECTGCGQCCTGGSDYVVEASREEQRRIQAYLGVTWRWFRRRYVRRFEDGSESLQDTNDACVFLGADRRCRIYGARPLQCRTYPFWPGVVTRKRDWTAEKSRCEGIGRGAVVPLSHIRAQLGARLKK